MDCYSQKEKRKLEINHKKFNVLAKKVKEEKQAEKEKREGKDGGPPPGEVPDVDMLKLDFEGYIDRYKSELANLRPGKADPSKIDIKI